MYIQELIWIFNYVIYFFLEINIFFKYKYNISIAYIHGRIGTSVWPEVGYFILLEIFNTKSPPLFKQPHLLKRQKTGTCGRYVKFEINMWCIIYIQLYIYIYIHFTINYIIIKMI